MALADVLGRVEADAEKALETLKEYCRFPTISAHKRAQPETAAFVRRLLVENGFEDLPVLFVDRETGATLRSQATAAPKARLTLTATRRKATPV